MRAVTASGVMLAAQQHIHLDRMQLLAVGDRAQVEPMLGELSLGPTSIIGDDDE